MTDRGEPVSTLPEVVASRLDQSKVLSDARAIMSDAVRAGYDVTGRRVEIRDEAGELLAVVPFADALSKRP